MTPATTTMSDSEVRPSKVASDGAKYEWADPKGAQEHLVPLVATFGVRAVARAAGLPQMTVQNVPRRGRISGSSAARILAVAPDDVVAAGDVAGRGYLPAGPVIARVRDLARVVAPSMIAEAAGVAKHTVCDLIHPSKCRPSIQHVHVNTWQRIFAVTLKDCLRQQGYVCAVGATRRMQALALNGWPSIAFARSGKVPSAVRVMAGTQKWVGSYPTYWAIVALYDELWDVTGPSARTRIRAERSGWAPAAAWDDDTIDDPATKPRK